MNYIRHLTTFYAYVRHDTRLTPCHISLYMALFQYWNFNRFQNIFPVYRENLMQLSKIGSKSTYHKCIRELHQARYIHYHPSLSKFQPIKISILRLDRKEEKEDTQLDLFAPPETAPIKTGTGNSAKSGTLSGTGISTVQVPDLDNSGTKNGTGTVPKVGRNIKLNNKHINSVCNTHTKNTENKLRIKQPGNGQADVPQMVHTNASHAIDPHRHPQYSDQYNDHRAKLVLAPHLAQVETFFHQNNYPSTEAKKFYYYNQAKGWNLQKNIPITDWQAVAHKWMLNPSINHNNTKNNKPNETATSATNNHPETDTDYTEPL